MENNLFGNFQLVPENKRGNVQELENKQNVSLPPLFKIFCGIFQLESLQADEGFRIYHPDEELGFYGFDFSLDELLGYFLEVGEPHTHRKMIPIATSEIHSGGICVCFEEGNIDKIFVNDEMSDDGFIEVASNIFDFICQLKQFSIKTS